MRAELLLFNPLRTPSAPSWAGQPKSHQTKAMRAPGWRNPNSARLDFSSLPPSLTFSTPFMFLSLSLLIFSLLLAARSPGCCQGCSASLLILFLILFSSFPRGAPHTPLLAPSLSNIPTFIFFFFFLPLP